MSMSDILAALLLLLVPLRHSKADRRMAKDTFALTQDMVVIIIIIIIIIIITTTTTVTINPDIVVLDKMERKCLIIDVACLFDTRVKDKEKEKIENYQDLKRKLRRIWKLCTETVVPVINGALGTVSKDIEKWLAEIGDTSNHRRKRAYWVQPESFAKS